MIHIRVDGNSEIGMGHVMRCLSIAEEIRSKNEEVRFITASKECVPIIESRGFQTVILENDYRKMMDEVSVVDEIKTDVILVDSYQVTNEYISKLRGKYKVACLDDMGISYPADMIINYNIYAPELEYSFDGDDMPELLLGGDYIPLRREFREGIEYELREQSKHILITTGGSDPLYLSKALVDTFLRNTMLNKKDLMYHIIIGPMNKYSDDLKKEYGKNSQVVLHENVSNMAEIMQECDVIISAAGSTVYEACAVGIPMICFYFVENQRRIAEYFEKNTDVINCGDFSVNDKIACFNAQDALVRCVIGRDTRRELHEQELKLVDGQGAGRIAKALIKLGGK